MQSTVKIWPSRAAMLLAVAILAAALAAVSVQPAMAHSREFGTVSGQPLCFIGCMGFVEASLNKGHDGKMQFKVIKQDPELGWMLHKKVLGKKYSPKKWTANFPYIGNNTMCKVKATFSAEGHDPISKTSAPFYC